MPEESFDLRRGSSNRKLSYRESTVERITCRALIDTEAEASYIYSSVINRKNIKPIGTRSKRIETLLSSSLKNVPVYSVEIKDINIVKDINNEFGFKTKINKLENSVLIQLPNSQIPISYICEI